MSQQTKQPARKEVFIVDDHPVFTDGLVTLFNHDPGLHVCGTATNGTQAVKEIRQLKPDVLIVDIGLPDKNGFQVIREVTALKRKIAILVVSGGDEMVQARAALKAGARGYVMKNEGPERLLEAVRQILADTTSVSPRVADQILQSMRRNHGVVDLRDSLSPREHQVLNLIGDGMSTAEIGKRLKISSKTVDAYRTSLRQKLGLADAHELLYFAVRLSSTGAFSQIQSPPK